MLFINNPQAAKAILEGRRDDGRCTIRETSPSRVDEAVQPSAVRHVHLPRLLTLLSSS